MPSGKVLEPKLQTYYWWLDSLKQVLAAHKSIQPVYSCINSPPKKKKSNKHNKLLHLSDLPFRNLNRVKKSRSLSYSSLHSSQSDMSSLESINDLIPTPVVSQLNSPSLSSDSDFPPLICCKKNIKVNNNCSKKQSLSEPPGLSLSEMPFSVLSESSFSEVLLPVPPGLSLSDPMNLFSHQHKSFVSLKFTFSEITKNTLIILISQFLSVTLYQ